MLEVLYIEGYLKKIETSDELYSLPDYHTFIATPNTVYIENILYFYPYKELRLSITKHLTQ